MKQFILIFILFTVVAAATSCASSKKYGCKGLSTEAKLK